MTVLWIILGFFGLLFFLSMLTAHAIVEYQDDVTLTLSVLFFKIPLFPAKKKKVRITDCSRKPTKKRKTKKMKKPKSAAPVQPLKEEKGILEKLDSLQKLLSVLLKNTFGHLKIRASRIQIRVGTTDAASTAILFGAVNQAIILVIEALDRFGKLTSKKQDVIEVVPDFLAEKTTTDIRIDFSLKIWQILDIALKTFVSYTESKNKNTK
jgi:hypothetical protein